MNEIEKIKKVEMHHEFFTPEKNKKFNSEYKTWDLTKKSTQASNNFYYDNNQTQNSLNNNVYGENKFKIQYDNVKQEIENSEKNLKRTSKFEVKINYKKNKIFRNSTSVSLKFLSDNKNLNSDIIDNKRKTFIQIINPNNRNDNNVLSNKNFKSLNFDDEYFDSNNNFFADYNTFSNKNFRKRTRRDAFGNIIEKKNKKNVNVTFLDLLQNKDQIEKRMKFKEKEKEETNLLYKIKNSRSDYNNSNNKYDYKAIYESNKKNRYNTTNNFFSYYDINNLKSNQNDKKEFIDIIKVESFKKYNVIFDDDEGVRAGCRSCGCVIF